MKIMTSATMLGSMLMAGQGFAAFSLEEIHQAAKIATDTFRVANPTHVEHLTGFKAWKSGNDVKTLIYVTHDGMRMEFLYLCHKHDATIECHVQ